ncbi:Rdx family protein [Desulfomicrobium sp. ZS1]|jgi:selT/selW/selH-like putative selenoprotein|uniref:Rdx family protein n=1 Tax=Desulfomicrobium sp. ZS1 TaxID=2952228 RepID=UPI0020B2EB3B|nr:Rdx family protein [Desulfomicrobium sp. ZS1]UTF50264.1 Rdx family protein [Desulfomicrobium sp. ZS1]
MGYEKRAASLADRLRVDAGAAVSLTQGSRGDFEILLDDMLIYSKQQTRRIPDADQILALVRQT